MKKDLKKQLKTIARKNQNIETKNNLSIIRQGKMRGITLIALVITIIVLLILAGVSIATLTGQNGILTRASESKAKTELEQARETMKLVVNGWQIEKNTNNSSSLEEYLKERVPSELDKVTKNADGTFTVEVNGYKGTINANGELVGELAKETDPSTDEGLFININKSETNPEGSMPEGAIVVEENDKKLNDANEGIVVKDKNNNEWVWIEVPKSEMPVSLTFTDDSDYDTLTAKLKEYASPYTEGKKDQGYIWKDEWYAEDDDTVISEGIANLTPKQKELDNGCGLNYEDYRETYKTMLKSVYANGGFWIARYEAGIEGTTGEDMSNGRTNSNKPSIDINTSPKAISQKDAIPYNFVTCCEAQKLSKEMSKNTGKTTSLLFGIQWDLVCKFLQVRGKMDEVDINSDSQEWGNYNNVLVPIDNGTNVKQYTTSAGIWSTITGEKSATQILLSTGASTKTRKMNIYDLSGNEFEWTLEHATSKDNYPCSFLGGSFNYSSSDYPASSRSSLTSTDSYSDDSFRPTLY